jgi:hypothetical protein
MLRVVQSIMLLSWTRRVIWRRGEATCSNTFCLRNDRGARRENCGMPALWIRPGNEKGRVSAVVRDGNLEVLAEFRV